MTEPVIGTYRMWTHKNKGTTYVIFQGIDPSIIIALGFGFEEIPERLRASIKVTHHVGFFIRFGAVRGVVGRTKVVGHCVFMFSSDQ
jgi:hypothetical protein